MSPMSSYFGSLAQIANSEKWCTDYRIDDCRFLWPWVTVKFSLPTAKLRTFQWNVSFRCAWVMMRERSFLSLRAPCRAARAHLQHWMLWIAAAASAARPIIRAVGDARKQSTPTRSTQGRVEDVDAACASADWRFSSVDEVWYNVSDSNRVRHGPNQRALDLTIATLRISQPDNEVYKCILYW